MSNPWHRRQRTPTATQSTEVADCSLKRRPAVAIARDRLRPTRCLSNSARRNSNSPHTPPATRHLSHPPQAKSYKLPFEPRTPNPERFSHAPPATSYMLLLNSEPRTLLLRATCHMPQATCYLLPARARLTRGCHQLEARSREIGTNPGIRSGVRREMRPSPPYCSSRGNRTRDPRSTWASSDAGCRSGSSV